MRCRECRQQIEAWLADAMEEEIAVQELPAEVIEHASRCPECRSRLEAARLVLNPASLRAQPPAGLADRITHRLHEHLEEREAGRFGGPAPEEETATGPADDEPGRFTSPRSLRLVAVAATLVAMLFAGILIGRALPDGPAGLASDQPAPGSVAAETQGSAAEARSAERTIRVEFRLQAPEAREVAVVGDWNGWDPAANPLTDRDGDGVWEATITLQPDGEYQYQFLIDDQKWIPDPSSPLKVDDGFGGMNSVLDI